MHYLFISLDYEHDEEFRRYAWSWNARDDVYLLHADVVRLKANGLSDDDIIEFIHRRIDDADAVLVIAGEWSNDTDADTQDHRELNWQHVGLRYALQQRKVMRGIKLFKHCEIPLPLRNTRGLHWQTLSSKKFNAAIAELFTDEL